MSELRSAGKAEAGSAGEQPDKAGPPATGLRRWGGRNTPLKLIPMSDRGRLHVCPGKALLVLTIGRDFPMPQKTHARRQPRGSRFVQTPLLLELYRRPIGKRRMQPYRIVDPFDELLQMCCKLFYRVVRAGIDFLLLQCLDEALAAAVLPWTACPAHAQYRTTAPSRSTYSTHAYCEP